MTDARFTAAVVAAQVLVQIGAFTLPALLPGHMDRWSLSATEAGWLVGIFFAAYVVAVPVLVALTDRLPAGRICLIGAGAARHRRLRRAGRGRHGARLRPDRAGDPGRAVGGAEARPRYALSTCSVV